MHSLWRVFDKKGMTEMSKLSIPVGISNFEKIRNGGFYYIDKTGLIAELVRSSAEVTLITRPRRFGKTLGMSMLESFFDIRKDSKKLFDGLEISHQKNLCEKWMNQWPVVFLSLKNVDGIHFSDAYQQLVYEISLLYQQHDNLLKSTALSDRDKFLFKQLQERQAGKTDIMRSLQFLTRLLEQHYGKKVILLIDEYDVPLDKAFQYGYYDEMVSLIRNMFGNVLKTNSSLFFAVLTGCLRIAKESIFTGLNNFNVFSITSVQFDEFFGFTDDEVAEMLKYFGLSDYHETIREWYDGYQFGKKAVYCPWDVISYCRNLCADPDAIPEDFWSNTSSNSIVSRFIDKANKQTRDEIENLISGETVIKEIKQELTYNELDKSIKNLWSILFTTGYLTQRERIDSRKLRLAIPNREIKELFELQIREWFQEKSSEDVKKLDKLCMAFPDGDAETIEDLFNDYLWNTISIRDTAVKGRKENFYHGVLLGLLSHMENWAVWSNIESGEGYCDILLEVPENRVGVVIEMKYAQEDRMEAACTEALKQIEQRQYAARLKSDGMENIVNYGIACYRKHCKVKIGKENS